MDQGTPPERTLMVVDIGVIRNDNTPRFESEPYPSELKQDADPSTEVTAVTARDTDERVNIFCPVYFTK